MRRLLRLHYAQFRSKTRQVQNDLEKWKAVGELIAQARDERPVRPLAKKAGISESYWRQIEKGFEVKRGTEFAVNPSEEVLGMMATVIEADIGAIFDAAGLDFDPSRKYEPIMTVEDRLERLERQVSEIADRIPKP